MKTRKPTEITAEWAAKAADRHQRDLYAGFNPLKLAENLIKTNSIKGKREAHMMPHAGVVWPDNALKKIDKAAATLRARGFRTSVAVNIFTVIW